jgi:LacI family transcriptional regulator
MARTSRIPRVLLLVETSRAYGRGLLEGIARYVRDRGPWTIDFEERGLEEPPPPGLRTWPGDGIIARTATRAMANALRATGLPVVELLGDGRSAMPNVHCDEPAIGRLAADHFLDRGLRHFAFFAFGRAWYIDLRREAFVRALAARGFGCHVYTPLPGRARTYPRWREEEQRRLVRWLSSLPQPLGLHTALDMHALRVLEACRSAGLAVPEQIAVLGVDNDAVLCDVATPPLSSIDLNSPRIGYEAAALLARRMAGRPPPKATRFIPPGFVATRQSTDVLAIGDPAVARAVRFIRERAAVGIDVPLVARTVALSRRGLERRFRAHLGRSPKKEILRVRMDRARELIEQTDLTLDAIGETSGFSSLSYFVKAFRRETGVTPRIYRLDRRVARHRPRTRPGRAPE